VVPAHYKRRSLGLCGRGEGRRPACYHCEVPRPLLTTASVRPWAPTRHALCRCQYPQRHKRSAERAALSRGAGNDRSVVTRMHYRSSDPLARNRCLPAAAQCATRAGAGIRVSGGITLSPAQNEHPRRPRGPPGAGTLIHPRGGRVSQNDFAPPGYPGGACPLFPRT
jgi:hypothetical protein